MADQETNEDPVVIDIDTQENNFEIGGFNSIEDFTNNGLKLIMETSKCINAFPSGVTRSLYSAFPAFNNIVDEQSQKILQVVSNVLKHQNIKGNFMRRDNDERFELLQECNDTMLERINSNLDELSGIRKVPETVLVATEIQSEPVANKQASGSWNEKTNATKMAKVARLLTARNIPRPQISFKIPVDNNSNTVFEPKLKYKPNSIKPLAILPEYADDGSIESYLHPYEVELTKFEVPAEQLKTVKPIKPKSLENTSLIFVDNQADLQKLLMDISKVQEIAVDLEHHSYRTFQGFTCIMQISTRENDYIIDTLALRDELHVLNEVFTNPKVVKVFHGADLDVEWLQRDLSIYVVNMFDTHQAAKRLTLARLSLAYLLKEYCQIEADKTFQLADWRIRPLPEELILYARQDTHYLLYIYDLLKNNLLRQANGQINLLQSVYDASKTICEKKYIKPKLLPNSHIEFYRKSKKIFDNRQLFALKTIYEWRDKLARQEDESYGYILPNHMMLQIAEILPREMQGILACCNPIPPLVRQNLHVLHQFVLKAREQPLVKPIPEEQSTNRVSALNKNKDLTGHLFCPHDLSYNLEFRDDLPTLLGNDKCVKSNNNVDLLLTNIKLKEKCAISIYDTPENSEDEIDERIQKVNQIKFVTPYARYLAMLPLAEKQRLEELAEQQRLNKKKKLCPDAEPDEYVIKQEPIVQVDKDNIYPSVPLQEVGKRKRNDEKVIEISESNDTIQPHKKFKVGTPSGSHTNNKKSKPATIVSSSKDNSDTSGSDNLNTITTQKLTITNDEKSSSGDDSNSPSQLNENDNKNKQIEKSNLNKIKKKFKKNKKNGNNQKVCQSSNKPIAFDYSQVDFKKFQGGSKKNPTNNDVQTKFHGKNKNNRGNSNKQFNKMFKFTKGPTSKKS